MRSVSVASAVRQFLAAVADQVSPSTFYLYKLYLTRFAKRFGRKHIADITPAMVRTWGKKYHPVSAVQRLFSWCKGEAMLITYNQLEQMRKLPQGKRLRIASRAETVRLKRASSTPFRALLVALDESIARPHEWREATWQHVFTAGLQPFTVADLVDGRAFIFRDKFKAKALRRDTAAVRVIPISKRLGRLLARRAAADSHQVGHIFLNERGRPWTINAVRCQMRKLRKAVGIVKDFRGENVVAYTMRHTVATAAIVAGVELATLASVMGHSDVRMTARYVHLSPDFLMKAMGTILEAKSARKRKNDRPGSLRKRPDDHR